MAEAVVKDVTADVSGATTQPINVELTADISQETTTPLNVSGETTTPLNVSGETTQPLNVELNADVSGKTTPPLNPGVAKVVVETPVEELFEEYKINPLLQPTTKTADEIVAEIMAEVSDEGVRNSLARMGELEDELQAKVENMQSTFQEYMTSIQEDIDKYWAIDKEFEKYHSSIDELCSDDGEKPASQQLREMMDAFKEGQYKEGLEKFTAGDEAEASNSKITSYSSTDQATGSDNTLITDQTVRVKASGCTVTTNDETDQATGTTVTANNVTDQVTDSTVTTNNATDQATGSTATTDNATDKNNTDISGEEVFEDAPTEIVPPTINVVADKRKVANDQVRVKSPRTKKTSEDTKTKTDEVKGKKVVKKKSVKH